MILRLGLKMTVFAESEANKQAKCGQWNQHRQASLGQFDACQTMHVGWPLLASLCGGWRCIQFALVTHYIIKMNMVANIFSLLLLELFLQILGHTLQPTICPLEAEGTSSGVQAYSYT